MNYNTDEMAEDMRIKPKEKLLDEIDVSSLEESKSSKAKNHYKYIDAIFDGTVGSGLGSAARYTTYDSLLEDVMMHFAIGSIFGGLISTAGSIICAPIDYVANKSERVRKFKERVSEPLPAILEEYARSFGIFMIGLVSLYPLHNMGNVPGGLDALSFIYKEVAPQIAHLPLIGTTVRKGAGLAYRGAKTLKEKVHIKF